jgi:hypothetical protein
MWNLSFTLYLSNEVGNLHPICTQECAPKIFPKSITLYPIPFAQKLWAYILHGRGKWQHFHTTFLIASKSFYLGALKTFDFFCEMPIKMDPLQRKLINIYCKYV